MEWILIRLPHALCRTSGQQPDMLSQGCLFAKENELNEQQQVVLPFDSLTSEWTMAPEKRMFADCRFSSTSIWRVGV